LEQIKTIQKELKRIELTGQQQDKPSAKVRELTKERNRLMRELGVDTQDDSRSAIISRLNNEAEELQRIIEGKAQPRKPNEPPTYTPEMEALAEKVKALRAAVKELHGPSEDEEWNQKAEKAARASEAAWNERVKNQEFESKKNPTPEATEATTQAKADAAKAKSCVRILLKKKLWTG